MNSARNALTDTTIIATAASACSQNMAHAESTWPWLMLPPAILTIAVIIVNILKQRTPQRENFRRRDILTFHSNITGTEITAPINVLYVQSSKRRDLHKISVIMSKMATALRMPFCLSRAWGVIHSTAGAHNQIKCARTRLRMRLLTDNSFVRVWTSNEIGEHQDWGCRDEQS